MYTPFSNPRTPPRRVARLPARPRSRSGQRAGSPNLLDPWQSLAQDPSVGPDAAIDSNRLSPPVADTQGALFQFGREENNAYAGGQSELFTFRLLHNVTPRPSPEPEEMDAFPARNLSSYFMNPPLPAVSTPEQEDPHASQPATSGEKLALDSSNYLCEPMKGLEIRLVPDSSAERSIAASSGFIPSLSFNQVSDPSPVLRRHSRTLSDVSMVSDQDEVRASYDVRDEKAPLEPFFTSGFQTALQSGLDIANCIVAAIEKMRGSLRLDGSLERLLKDARELSTFQSSDTRTIAVLGDSGEGKSSLINSLLHFPGIAKTGDIGSACTSVVTEYRQKTTHHAAPITIEVEYLASSEIEEHITELVWNYRKVLIPLTESDRLEDSGYLRYQRESEQAWSALEAAFKHQKLFNNELLSDTSEGALEKVTLQLIQWSRELIWPEGGENGIWKSTADTAQECCEQTSVFMQDRFWPFTKIIRVYLSAQVLKTGIVLADLPGLQDTNLARVRVTQKYLMNSDHVFIATKISRAITDQSLKSSLNDVLTRHVFLEWELSAGKTMHLAIICTKSEDINHTVARQEFCGADKRISMSDMENLDKDIEDAKKAGDRKLKKVLKRRQEFLLVEARNNHVKEGLRRVYASKILGGKLEVFCVSNTTYEKYARKGNAEMVHASGVPELRRFCHTITAGAQLLEAKHFLQSTLSSLLSSVGLWANSSPNRPKVTTRVSDESIYEKLKEVKAKVSEIFTSSRDSLKNAFRELVLEFLEEKRNDFWEGEAKAKGESWSTWLYPHYNAWCLNDGDHQTPKQPYVNWNSELIWKMRMELAYQWDVMDEEIPDVIDNLLTSVQQQLALLKSFIRESGFVPAVAEAIDSRVKDIDYKFNMAQQNCAKEFKIIRRNASEANRCSYIVSEMIPAYRSANREHGQGKSRRQKDLVQGRITNGSLMPNISMAISNDTEKIFNKTFRELLDKVNVVLDHIKSDIDIALTVRNEDDKREEMPRVALASELEGLKKRHQEVLRNISVY